MATVRITKYLGWRLLIRTLFGVDKAVDVVTTTNWKYFISNLPLDGIAEQNFAGLTASQIVAENTSNASVTALGWDDATKTATVTFTVNMRTNLAYGNQGGGIYNLNGQSFAMRHPSNSQWGWACRLDAVFTDPSEQSRTVILVASLKFKGATC